MKKERSTERRETKDGKDDRVTYAQSITEEREEIVIEEGEREREREREKR
jgi:hypothetical protein